MGQRGRKSAASQEVATLSQVTRVERPDAPYDLTDDQADVWRMVVDSEAADFFSPAVFPSLSAFCRHVVTSRLISRQVDAMERGESFDVDEYDKLLKLREREDRAAEALARGLRITNQARYDKSKKRAGPKSRVLDWK